MTERYRKPDVTSENPGLFPLAPDMVHYIPLEPQQGTPELLTSPPDPSDLQGDRALDEAIRLSLKQYGDPTALFHEILANTPTEKLADVFAVIKRLETTVHIHILWESVWEEPTAYSAWASSPNFIRSRILSEETIAVPVADHSSIAEFLDNIHVDEILREEYTDDTVEDSDDDNIKELPPIEYTPALRKRPVVFTPIDTTEFFTTIEQRWLESPDIELIPGKILENMIESASAEELLRILLTLEDSGPFERSEQEPPIVNVYFHPDVYEFHEGVIWQKMSVEGIRSDLLELARKYYASNRSSLQDDTLEFHFEEFVKNKMEQK